MTGRARWAGTPVPVGVDAGGSKAVPAGVKDSLVQPLGLTVEERGHLVDFLKSLTGKPVAPHLLKDTSAP